MEQYVYSKDYRDFCKVFGKDREQLYLSLRELRERTKKTWEDIGKMKWDQIDMENKSIQIPVA